MFSKNNLAPPPTHILSQMRSDGFRLYWNNARTTMHEAAIGYVWGNALAITLAFAFLVAPVLERPLMRLGIASYCLPVIAIGPILQIVFNGQTPKIILAALSVFFTTLVGTLVGLRSADKTTLDVIHAYGGNSFKKLTKVRLRAALPSLFAALRIAAPAAILGAIIGEYLGADTGLGVAMINSEQALQIERTWAIALVATALAGIAYGITALVGRLLTPWATTKARA
jgi:ABC-type nitrate/sulfonate/bicarbonate transport system permease component